MRVEAQKAASDGRREPALISVHLSEDRRFTAHAYVLVDGYGVYVDENWLGVLALEVQAAIAALQARAVSR